MTLSANQNRDGRDDMGQNQDDSDRDTGVGSTTQEDREYAS